MNYTLLLNQNILRYGILLFVFLLSFTNIFGQITSKDDYTSLYPIRPDKKGFEVSVSAVAMFTMGAKDRNGFRLGGGLNLSQDIGDFKLSTGIDFYKAQQNFGIGTTYAGVGYNDGRYGASYFVNKYFQGDKQLSGIINLHLGEWQIRFEDDILALPFTGFVIYDRCRTAAIEVRYRHFMVGTNVYTTDANGLTDVSSTNAKGIYHTGKQISSPIYIGYTNKNLIVRYGFNSSLGGYVGQNSWHEYIFETANFRSGNYRNQFLQLGTDKPYTLY